MPLATCPLCEATCGIEVEIEGRRITGIRGDDDDPFSRGYICPKASALADLHEDPDRLRAPLVREGSRWRETTWDDAVERAAEGLRRARRDDRDAVAMYYGNPVAHNLGLLVHGLAFSRALGTRNLYSASSTDQLPQMVAAYFMFGHLALLPVPDVDRTDLFYVFGANPLVSNGSIMTAPDMKRRLRALRERGGRLVVFDPRRTETAEIADEHVFVRPGTDALVLLAMLHVIFAEERAKLGRFEGRVHGLRALAALAREHPPERVAQRTGVPAETLARLARDLAHTERAAVYGRVGLCTQRLGTVSSFLVQALNLVTRHLDEVGGAMITTPAIDFAAWITRAGLRGGYDRWRSRARGMPEFAGEYPIATLADEIETPGRGQVRALLVVAGNPVLSAPNGKRLERALPSLEHVVAVDGYLNETTRHAHVILPPAPPLSRAHYDVALNAFAVRNVAKWADPVVPRAAHERHDWEILGELAARTLAPRALLGAALAAARALTPERIVDAGLRAGPWGLTLSELRRHPHGLDLGPLEPGRLAESLPGGRVNLARELLEEARREIARELSRADHGLVLIGRRHLRSNNSWMHNAHRLVKGPARCTLLVHPEDARERGLASGDRAKLASEAGEVIVPIEITSDILRGVVSLPHGWGHHREGTRLSVARDHAGVSANDVTSDAFLDTMSGTAGFNGLRVTLERA